MTLSRCDSIYKQISNVINRQFITRTLTSFKFSKMWKTFFLIFLTILCGLTSAQLPLPENSTCEGFCESHLNFTAKDVKNIF